LRSRSLRHDALFRRSVSDVHPFGRSAVFASLAVVFAASVLVSSCFVLNVRDDSTGDKKASTLLATIADLTATPDDVKPGEPVTFYANASSSTSSSLTFIIYYDSELPDGSNNTQSPYDVFVTGNPGSIVATHTYDHVGNLTDEYGTYFLVKLYVYDGSSVTFKREWVWVVDNHEPTFTLSLPPGQQLEIGEAFNFSASVVDKDGDSLTATWEFGDGTPDAVNETGPAAAGVWINQTHAWTPVIVPGTGDYYVSFIMNLSISDGNGGFLNDTVEITIWIDHNFSPVISLSTARNTVDPSDEVLLVGRANDYEGESMTWTFVFNNSVTDYHSEVYYTPETEDNATVWVNTTHTFGAIGNYTVTLWVSDTVEDLQTGAHNKSYPIVLNVQVNRAPFVLENITVSPAEPLFNTTLGFALVTCSTEVNDPDGDALTITWDFGDGTDLAVDVTPAVTATYTVSHSHNYTVAGYYNVTMVVSDGRDGHDVVKYKFVAVASNNRAPSVRAFNIALSHGVFGLPGTNVEISLVLTDRERDSIVVFWDFGDNSTLVRMESSLFDETGNCTFFVNYSYDVAKEYTITVWFTDNQFGSSSVHNNTAFSLVSIRGVSLETDRYWNTLDYAGLVLLFGGVAFIFARWIYLGRKRRKLDMMGMTLEEYNILQMERGSKFDRRGRTSGGSEGGLNP